MSQDELFVKQSLSAIGVDLPPDDVEMLVSLNPGFRQMAAGLYAVAEAAEEDPELLFRAETTWTECSQTGGRS